jgi:hypothetical protein
LAAPPEDGAVFALPPLERCGELLAENARRLERDVEIGGLSLTELRQIARTSFLQEAAEYLRQADEPVPSIKGRCVLMGGHQPELFHPGVWLKNFALAGLARRYDAVAVNIIVDSDTMKSAHVRVPAPSDGQSPFPHLRTVAFDRWQGEVPYESCAVQDEAMFAGFADEAGAILKSWRLNALLPEYWQMALHQAPRTNLLGERLVAARRMLERSWGCHNLEVPISRLCRTESFARLTYHLLEALPLLHAVYNECVRAHRRLHRMRSRNHPVPDLAAEGDWLEVPLWAWRAGQKQRGRLFARRRIGVFELRAGGEAWPSLPADADRAVAALLDLFGQGFALRTRALLTAMYARLLLGDLFIHGIGGAKYDELTDRIMQRFFGIEPPHFVALSGTLRLPLPAYPVSSADRARLGREMRDLRFNPQRHLEEFASVSSSLGELAERKRRWIADRPDDSVRLRERHWELKELNRQMAPYFDEAHSRLGDESALVNVKLHANAVLQRRDYAFCLYPESLIRPFCTQMLKAGEAP